MIMETYITKNGIKYELRGEQYYPMLKISEQTNYEIGKYGHLHLNFIKKNRRGTIYHPAYRRTALIPITEAMIKNNPGRRKFSVNGMHFLLQLFLAYDIMVSTQADKSSFGASF